MASNARDTVRLHISQEILLGEHLKLGDEDSLIDGGVLDSTGIVELVMFLEKRFSISIENEEFTPENLETVAAICGLIHRKTRKAA